MRSKKEDYTEEELRRILLKRTQVARQQRLREFHRSGKIRLQETYLSPNHSLAKSSKKTGRRDRSWLGIFLKTIEITLLIGILVLGLSGWRMLGKLNKKTLDNLQLPVIPPTPLVTPVDLPSGHRASPTSIIVYQPFPKVHGLESPTGRYIPLTLNKRTTPEFATRIIIPAIEIDAPIVYGVESEQLKKGVGQVPGSANPGENGNLVLSAHNDIYGELFRYLDKLKSGDQFTVYTNIRSYTYTITGSELVEPSRVEVMVPTPDATATLISCYPYLIDTMRIIVKARLINS
jgi:sortase A